MRRERGNGTTHFGCGEDPHPKPPLYPHPTPYQEDKGFAIALDKCVALASVIDGNQMESHQENTKRIAKNTIVLYVKMIFVLLVALFFSLVLDGQSD